MNRVGPADKSDVNDPSGFTHVVDVSDRSDNASTRCPDNRAATRADATSAASDTAGFAAGAAGLAVAAGAANAAGASNPPANNATETTTANRRPHRARR